MKAAADVFEIFQNREKRKAEQEAAMLDEWPEPGEIKESALLPDSSLALISALFSKNNLTIRVSPR